MPPPAFSTAAIAPFEAPVTSMVNFAFNSPFASKRTPWRPFFTMPLARSTSSVTGFLASILPLATAASRLPSVSSA